MMEEIVDEDDMLHHHSHIIDDLLKDSDYGGESSLHISGGLGSSSNIWANQCSSPISNDFLPYRGLANGYHNDAGSNHWPAYGSSTFTNGSASRDESFTFSQAESDTGSDHSGWRYDGQLNGVDFCRASNEGAQCYAEALDRWSGMNGSANGMYDPFKSSSVIDNLGGVQMSMPAREKSPLRRSKSANSRPTFADVAKKPSSPGSEPPPTPSLSNDGHVYESQESLNSLVEKAKPRAFRPAHPRHGGYHVPLPIKPDSKYGLDDFEVQETGVGKMERSFSCNDALDCSSQAADLKFEDKPDSESVGADNAPEKGRDWFDPKRIFQNGTSRSRSESVPCDTILNNNLAARAQPVKNPERRSNASYINNLHDGNHRTAKQNNAERAKPVMNGNGTAGRKSQLDEDGEAGGRACNGSSGHVSGDHAVSGRAHGKPILAAGYSLSGSVKLGKAMAVEAFRYILLALMVIIGLTGQVVYFVVNHTCVIVTRTYTYLAVKVGLNSGTPTEKDFNSFTNNTEEFKYGLEENIKLPETSEEAMRRLLTCQGKDAYSILGICSDASDEEIRRYYRRQAVLVHPDKNQQPGAEEAFKILGQAVELIGTPEKRTVYDRKIQEEKLSEDVMQQFSDLLTKFHEKMEEASNWMQCNNCGDKHRRYPTDKPLYSARKCNRCQCHHAAKEGEIWAETTFMGFKWHFYACMDNRIYDVTPWISCQPNMVDKFQPNSHTVRLRMSLSNNGHPPTRPGSTNASREAELENLLKNLFPPPNTATTPGKQPSRQPAADGNAKSNGTPCNKKGKRRARRR